MTQYVVLYYEVIDMKSILLWKWSVLDAVKLEDTEWEARFHKLYEDQKRAVWFPEEINVEQDVNDYHSLNDQERQIFRYLIGYFVGTELLVQNVLGDAFYAHIASPRAKMALTVQMFMEAIHNDFFEMVLNSFNMNRDELYNISDTNPVIAKKRAMVAKAADAINSRGNVDPDTLEGKKAILHAILINNILQEGIFFYSAFAIFFAMRESGKMQRVSNGIDLVLIDESMHLKMGMEMIFAIIDEAPEIAEDAEFLEMIQATLIEWVELECEFLRGLFEQGIVFGLNLKEMEEYLKFIADRRLQELGFAAHYGVENNPLQFLEKQDVMTLQNFFEVTPNQYTNF